MKEFRSLEDVERARLPLHVGRVVLQAVESLLHAYAEAGEEYRPEDDGYVVLVERGDGADAIRPVLGGRTLFDAPFEGVSRDGGFYFAVWLANNQFGITLIVPDEPWLDHAVRSRLANEAEGR